MKKSIVAIVAVAASILCLTLQAGNLILVGDSTLAPRKPDVKLGSWGDSMGDKLADGWQIVNVAVGGKTVRTIQEKPGKSSWDKALKTTQKGDFVIVQFGINDANPKKLVTVPDFKTELAKFADLIREKGATPVFCSPVSNCGFDKNGAYTCSKSRTTYATATKEVAAEKKVDFVDMTQLTGAVLASVGKEVGETYYVGSTTKNGKTVFDRTHPAKLGARIYGETFIKDVKARKLSIAAIFR